MPARLLLTAAGYDHRHERGFTIDRPRGLGEWLFVHFTVPVLVRDATGEHAHPAGSRLLHAPDCPQWYRGQQRGLANDWCHFVGDDAAELVARYGVVHDRVLPPTADRTPATLLLALARQRARREQHAGEAAACLLELLLIVHGRHAVAAAAPAPDAELVRRFRELRERVHASLAHAWSVDEMASAAGLHASQFSALYRRIFGSSPIADLIEARVQHARWLLAATALPVREVALRCGFADPRHFARCFRARTGATPLGFRCGAR